MSLTLPFFAAVLWIAAATLIGLPWFTPKDRRPTIPEVGISATLGLGLAGLLMLLARASGFSMSLSKVCLISVLGGWALAILRRRGRFAVPLVPNLFDPLTLWTFALSVAWISPTVVGALLMSRGPYPEAFFNVDTPFRLNHVYELVRGTGFPPSSIANFGVTGTDHFGGPAVAAALVLVSGLSPHKALFAVVLPVVGIGVYCIAVLLTNRLVDRGHRLLWMAALLLILTAWFWPVLDVLTAARRSVSSGTTTPLFMLLSNVWHDPQSFNNYFEDITHSLSKALFLVACLALASPNSRSIAAATLSVVLLGQVKTGHVVIAGIALGVACATQAFRTRSVRPLLALVIGGVGSLLLIRLGRVDGLFRIVAEPLWMVRHFPDVLARDVLTFAVIVAVPVSVLVLGPRNRTLEAVRSPGVAGLLVATLCVYGFFQMFGAIGIGRSWVPVEPAREGPFREFLEPLLLMPIWFACTTAAFAASLWLDSGRGRRAALLAVIGLLVAPAIAHRAYGVMLMANDPGRAHEYVDNRELGAALSSIPVSGTMVATNDLRYPANHYGRDLLQFQISAILGHQAFGLPGYERYPGWEERVTLQRALAQTDVTRETLLALAGRGVTHLVIHKLVPHPADLALPKLYESPRYVVYRLRSW